MTDTFNCYKNLKILVTGHSGFKGSWLTLWLNQLGAKVIGYSLPPSTEPAMFNELNHHTKCINIFGDIRDLDSLKNAFTLHKPDIVFHLAAQPLVRQSYFEPVQTYATNVIGTLNVLEAARNCPSVRAFVNVTTDKCYENKEINYAYKEDDKLGGYDMYSSSKACSEILTSSYRNSFLQRGKGFLLASARAGNVIGGGDWAADRLIPDCIRAIEKNQETGNREQGTEEIISPSTVQPFNLSTKNNGSPIIIRSPQAIRPWQHVLEPLCGYLTLGEKLLKFDLENEKYAQGFNFGPNSDGVLTVGEVAQKVVNYYGKGEIIINKSDNLVDNLHEANLLMLDIQKAQEILGWQPKYSPDEAIKATVEWYKKFYAGENMLEFTIEQIENYAKTAEKSIF
jgi:CDP-glucose 4,6-dehydratase